MSVLADLSINSSEFEPRFLKILQDSGVEKDEFEGLEYFTWLPFFVIAGATVKPKIHVHGDHTHFEGAIIEVADDELELFLTAIPHLLKQAADAYEGVAESQEG